MVAKYVSNIIRMRSWIACWICLKSSLSLLILFLGCLTCGYSQSQYAQPDTRTFHFTSQSQLSSHHQPLYGRSLSLSVAQDTITQPGDSLPSPNSVMYKSMIIPGWGQITNRQIWKVPIVYGLLGGL